jgi:hypothetical protein
MIAQSVVLWLHVLCAAGDDTPAIDAPVPTDRIESIAMEMGGPGGTVVTRAIALDGGRARYVFGGRTCREHKVEPVVLEQMFEAMRARQGVRVSGKIVGTGETAVQCLASITFFAPEA